MKLHYIILLTIILFTACKSSTKPGITNQPTLADFHLGETWVWKYKGVTTEGEVRSDGTDKRMIVQMKEGLGMTIGNETIPLADIVQVDESEKP